MSTENTFTYEQIGSNFPVNPNSWSTTGYFSRISWAKLNTSVNKDYFYDSGNQKIVETTQGYTYNSTNRQIEEQTMSNSLGETVKTKYYYHTGNSTLSKNRIAELEKVEKYRDAVLLTTARINYSNTFAGNASYLPATISTSKEAASPETRLRYTAYDEYSNPLQVRQENGLITSYIWGYNKNLPIAKIENVAYASIPSATITDLQTKSNTANNEANLLTALNALRTAFPSAMITTFTHKPLIGVSTVTDPKGDKISYVYDDFNRLKEVRDKNNNILSENEYFYRGASTSVQNYIKNKTYKVATTTSIGSPTITQASQGKTYYDGLGRTIQQVANAQSGTGKDIITHIEYDVFGRKEKSYLPFASSQNTMDYIDGTTLKANIITQYQTKYGDTNPFSEKLIESSPMSRLLEQAAPGNDWALNNSVKHTVRFDYQTNVANEVKLFKATSSGTGASGGSYTISLVNGSGSVFYPANELYKSIIKNENWKTGDGNNNTTEEFTDKEGRVIMKRTYGVSVVNEVETSVWHETYNVYDQHGNLTFVLPPNADGSIDTTVLGNLCYQYKYDHRNRVVEKKSPGKDWEFIVYDQLDRVVAVGPSKSSFSNSTASGWLITKYDVYSRVAYTGWENTSVSSAARATKQNTQNSLTTHSETKRTSGLTIDGISVFWNNAITPTAFKLLSVNYYDDYAFPTPPTIPSTVETQTVYYNNTTKPIGLPTASWIRALSLLTDTAGESSYILYDAKARPLRTYKTNHLGGYTQVDNSMNTFSGRINYTITRHKRLAADPTEIFIKDAFSYTNQDRLLAHTHQIGAGGTPQLLNKNSYDELGQLTNKQVGGTDITTYVGLQKVDYSYNIRGWLTAINDVTDLKLTTENDLFAFNINYNGTIANNISNTVTPLYNGNIAEISWRTKQDNIRRRYGYSYDHLNRLKKAVYQKPDNATPVTNSYNESMTYDKNGNIKALQRNGEYDDAVYKLTMDNLVYTYDTNKLNQLMKVVDNSGSTKGFKDGANLDNDYAYDNDGNLLTDQNKGITATVYNHLNLPTKITFGANGTIEYLYNGGGKKLKKTVTQGTDVVVTEYLDGFQYEKVNANAVTLDYFGHAEGYVKNTVVSGNNNYNYVFNYTDHLGNIRLSYGLNSSGVLTILEENNYYPYGLRHKNYNMSRNVYRGNGFDIDLEPCTNCPRSFQDKFNGKSWEDELGLNIYAMDMRQFDPAIARWVVQDPVIHHNQSQYNGFDGNPVFWADPSGADANTSLGSDLNGNRRYNSYGLFIPMTERGVSNNMEARAIASGGKVISSDSNGSWIRYTRETVSYELNFDADDLLKMIELSVISLTTYYEYEFIPNSSSLDRYNKMANVIDIGMGVKEELWTIAISRNFKSARNPWAFAKLKGTQQAWRTTNTLGKFGSNALVATKVLGAAAGAIQVGIKGWEIYNKGAENATVRDWTDLGVNSAGLVAVVFLASNPVGWAIGAGALAYSIGTTIYDAYNKD